MSNQSDQELTQITIPAAGSEAAPEQLRLEDVREKLSQSRGRKYWRTLDELSGTKEFGEMMQREFPRQASEWVDPVSRRGFMKLMGASMALAGLSACTKQPYEAIVPYVKQPEDLIPGKPKYFATVHPFPTGAVPVLAKSNEFRPTKIEGNPLHPLNGGQKGEYAIAPTDAITQASVLDLWDPDRSQMILQHDEVREWGHFEMEMRTLLNEQKGSKGAGIRFLSGTVTSPTLAEQLQGVLKTYSSAKWYQYEPINRDGARAGLKSVFGRYVDAQYKLDAADVIVSLDADFLSGAPFPGFLALARQYAGRRNPDQKMNRLYVVESAMTTTGAKAEHRQALRAGDVEQFAAALANALGVNAGSGSLAKIDANQAALQKYFNALVEDLKAAHGTSVVIAGEYQSPNVHALAALMNQALGNIGKTVVYGDPIEPVPTEQVAGLRELVADMNAGKVSLLVMLGVNPIYNAPVDLEFEKALDKVATKVHLGLYRDETAVLCDWHVHETHYLEAWSDARAYDGTASVIQPLIEPLYGGRSAHEVVQIFSDTPGVSSYDLVRAYWKGKLKGDFEASWRRAVHDGFIAGSASTAASAVPHAASLQIAAPKDVKEIEISFRPDPSLYDGRYANNGWLQELPKQITKLTWDNAVIMSIETAKAHGVWENKLVWLGYGGQAKIVKGSVLVVPGHPDNSITIYLGHGRSMGGRVGTGIGFNSYLLRKSDAPFIGSDLALLVTDEEYRLVVTTSHEIIQESESLSVKSKDYSIKGDPGKLVSQPGYEAKDRGLIQIATLDEYKKNPNFAHEGATGAEPIDSSTTLYKPSDFPQSQYAWGMSIDMNSCVGCNACVVACVAENNIAVVGKDQVAVGRAMHWLRIDTYYQGDAHNPTASFQPLPCQQCENAPCEPVCPVGATVHSSEGLNNMVYNRCVGTRYCSNNCPYKVRHFNFLLFSDFTTQSLVGVRNPDVSVRSRGVMEKCTYCVQRINSVRIQAEKEEREIHDGEIVTACQQSCPTSAITFGNIHDQGSKVSKDKSQSRNYTLLTDLNTRPRTTYIAGVTNPNPALPAENAPENS